MQLLCELGNVKCLGKGKYIENNVCRMYSLAPFSINNVGSSLAYCLIVITFCVPSIDTLDIKLNVSNKFTLK